MTVAGDSHGVRPALRIDASPPDQVEPDITGRCALGNRSAGEGVGRPGVALPLPGEGGAEAVRLFAVELHILNDVHGHFAHLGADGAGQGSSHGQGDDLRVAPDDGIASLVSGVGGGVEPDKRETRRDDDQSDQGDGDVDTMQPAVRGQVLQP